jgi:hypothetical protein
MNQSIEQYLHTFINYSEYDWKEWLSIAELTYNNSVHAAMQQTSIMANTPGQEKTQNEKLEMNWQ